MSTEFRLINNQAEPYYLWLQSLVLPGEESRQRTRFAEILLRQIQKIAESKQELLKKYANKDSEGDPMIVVQNDGKKVYDVSPENYKELEKEYGKILGTEFVLDLTGSLIETFQTVRRITLLTTYEFGPRDSDEPAVKALRAKQQQDYAVWCDALEAVQIA